MSVQLGKYLASIRTDRGLTLRQVEEAADHKVSNAYLSQLENGKIKKPSPNVLHVLAQVYGVGYEQLMAMAGYVSATENEPPKKRQRAPTLLSQHQITSDEEEQLLEYLRFIRTRKTR